MTPFGRYHGKALGHQNGGLIFGNNSRTGEHIANLKRCAAINGDVGFLACTVRQVDGAGRLAVGSPPGLRWCSHRFHHLGLITVLCAQCQRPSQDLDIETGYGAAVLALVLRLEQGAQLRRAAGVEGLVGQVQRDLMALPGIAGIGAADLVRIGIRCGELDGGQCLGVHALKYSVECPRIERGEALIVAAHDLIGNRCLQEADG